MTLRTSFATALTAAILFAASGCAVMRGQESTGAYVDDASITTSVKAETLNGTVMLSGFAKNALEKSTAERIARDTKGVKSVKNEIAIRP